MTCSPPSLSYYRARANELLVDLASSSDTVKITERNGRIVIKRTTRSKTTFDNFRQETRRTIMHTFGVDSHVVPYREVRHSKSATDNSELSVEAYLLS
jgi:hypothetical protein